MKKAISFGVLLLILLSLFGTVGYGYADPAFDDWFFRYSAPDFPEEYRHLIRIVPEGAYCAEQRMDLATVPYGDHGYGPEAGLIYALFHSGVFTIPETDSNNPEWENNPDAQRAPAYEVERVCEETFGPGSFELFKNREYFNDYTNHFFYRADTDSYEYIRRTVGGGIDSARVYVAFEGIEERGEALSLYVRYASYSNLLIEEDDRFRLYADARMRLSGRHEPYFSAEDPGSYLNFVADGGLNEALPLYKHTFRANGAGGHYWESTELVSEADTDRIAALLAGLPSQTVSGALFSGSGVIKDVPPEYELALCRVPVGAYLGTSVSVGDSLRGLESHRTVGQIFLNALQEKGYLALDLPIIGSVPEIRLPVTVVRSVYDDLFGAGRFDSLEDRSRFGVSGIFLEYDSARGDYRLTVTPGMGGAVLGSLLEWYERSESDGETLSLYVRAAVGKRNYSPAGYEIYCSLQDYQGGDVGLALGSGRLSSETAFSEGEWLHITLTEPLRERLSLYRHDFLLQESGYYAWVGTEPVESGEKIPADLIAEKENDASDGSDLDSDLTSDISSDPDSGTDTSPIVITDGKAPGREENLFLAIWICAGVAAVALVCMFVPVVMKKTRNGKGVS